MIHPTAVIYPNVTIGENVTIGAYCIIGAPPEHTEYFSETNEGVIIQDGATITGMATIDAGIKRPTVIGKNSFIMKHAYIGHDCTIESNVIISCGAKIGGHSVIMERANIGLNASIHQFSIIAPYSMIGMGSVVPKNVKIEPFQVYVGNPVRHLKENSYLIDKFGISINDRIIISDKYYYILWKK